MPTAFFVLLLLWVNNGGDHGISNNGEGAPEGAYLVKAVTARAQTPQRRFLGKPLDVTLSSGVRITPHGTATQRYTGTMLYSQDSRLGPATAMQVRYWLTQHSAVSLETGYGNSNTVLGANPQNSLGWTKLAWTMNTVTVDAAYQYRVFQNRRFAATIKGGLGAMVFVSGMASENQGSAGVDCRMEELAGIDTAYRISDRVSFHMGYEARFLRNPDFADHDWFPVRNIVAQPTVGFTFNFKKPGLR